MDRTIEDFVRGLELDAYLVGGAVRDELLGLESKDADFLVPASTTTAAPRARAAREGRGARGGRTTVGARLYPRDKRCVPRRRRDRVRAAARRAEHRPGRHDFEIVADPGSRSRTTWRRRDFTVNAIARRLDTGELVDPFNGQKI
jgi:tRNA nucleotidyltransferase (CCA-adding enzyme)